MNRAAARAHRVDHRNPARRDIIAVAHAAGRVPADRWQAERSTAALHQFEQARRGGIERLRRAVEAAMDVAMYIMLARYRGDGAAQRRFGFDHRFGDRKSTRLNSS